MSDLEAGFFPSLALEPKDRFVLVPKTATLQDGTTYTFSDQGMKNVVSAFKALGRPLAIDYEHQTLGTIPGFEHFRSPDGTAPAAGWIGDLSVAADGIWAEDTKWTPKALKALQDGEYRFHSPVLFWPKGQQWKGDPSALGPAALTNDPDINGLQAVAARCSHAQLLTLMQESNMDPLKKLLGELMGLDANAPEEQFATALKAKWTEVTSAVTASKSVPDLQTKITAKDGEISALKSTHATELTALKSTHATEITALKTTHTTEISTMKHDIATVIADSLEQTGRIATADKQHVLDAAKKDHKFVIVAFKSVKVGAVVPIGQLGIKPGKDEISEIGSPNDQISASKAMQGADTGRLELHHKSVAYADKHKISYADAVLAVSKQTA